MAKTTDSNYNMFTDLKTPQDMTQYTLFRGTTDFTQLKQFNLFETGYPYLVVVSVPEFLEKMAENNSEVKSLLDSYVHILEYEFRGIDNGIDNISTDTGEINNGIQSLNVITKTNMPAQNFSMQYYEKAGSIITKMHQLYLRSVKDPGTGFKTYNGLISNDEKAIIKPSEAGFHKECFSFLYMHTDNTGLLLEQAVYYVAAMPTTAELSIYNSQKGDIGFKEISVEFSGFPIMGKAVNRRAKAILDWMNNSSNDNMVQRNSWNYEYKGVSDSITGLSQSSLSSKKQTKTER